MGKMEDPLPLIRHCDIGVLTSESEGLSNSIMEYMACGLPVVCTDVGGNPELVRHGENGYLFPAGDVTATHHAPHRPVQDRGQAHSDGRDGKQRASGFSLEVDCRQLCTAVHRDFWPADRHCILNRQPVTGSDRAENLATASSRTASSLDQFRRSRTCRRPDSPIC